MIDKRKFYINGQWIDPIKKNDLETILSLCDDLISNKGAAFGIAVARDITELYLTLSDENKLLFFKRINEKYFRPTEVETLLGDPSKSRNNLNWNPWKKCKNWKGLVSEMLYVDTKEAVDTGNLLI